MNIIKKIFRTLSFSSSIIETYFLFKKHLKPKGWVLSRYLYQPVDSDGQPIPWVTYASLHFISQKLENTSFNLFEYGSGNSTLWFSKRVKYIISVEHDANYYEIIKNKIKLPSNITYILSDIKNDYSKKVLDYKDEFHIIIIDGRDRITCTKNSLKALRQDGIIIWDNSDREKYQEAYDFLSNAGFKKIDFKGLGPIGHIEWQTSIFYKSNNCFNI
jgi:hypothetical protein|tara:strand:+ start:1622 stop:2269 length:648 start_codon:yes stop_codon:yes gene_type:complete